MARWTPAPGFLLPWASTRFNFTVAPPGPRVNGATLFYTGGSLRSGSPATGAAKGQALPMPFFPGLPGAALAGPSVHTGPVPASVQGRATPMRGPLLLTQATVSTKGSTCLEPAIARQAQCGSTQVAVWDPDSRPFLPQGERVTSTVQQKQNTVSCVNPRCPKDRHADTCVRR